MFDFFRLDRFRTGRPSRPLFVLVSMCFLLAVVFSIGLEAFGHHDHDGWTPDQNCAACRHAETPTSTAPDESGLGARILPDVTAEQPLDSAEVPVCHDPAPSFLRGPPRA